MNKKRLAAYVAAAAMLLNVTPVMASQTTTVQNATGSSVVTGDSTVDGVDMSDVFSVTLPTSNALNFTVDPYGLLTATDGAVKSTDDLADTGVIMSASGSAAMIKNESSVPVTVDVKLRGIASGTATFVTGGSVVASGSSANLFLSLIPSATKSAVETDGTVTNYDASSYVIPITTNESTTKFQLKNADYEIKKISGSNTFQIVSKAGNYDSTVFKVGGIVNSKADWSKFSGASPSSKLNIGAVFSFAKSPDTEELDNTLGVYGLVSGQAVKFTDDTSAGNSDSEYTRTWTSGDVSFTIPAGAQTIAWIEIDGTTMNRGFSLSYDGGTTLTIPARELTGGWHTAKLKVGYTNGTADVIINMTNGNN